MNKELETLKVLYQRGLDNGVKDLEFCSKKRIFELENKINPLYDPTTEEALLIVVYS